MKLNLIILSIFSLFLGLLNQSHGHSGTFLALTGKDGLVLATDSRTTKSQSQAFLIGYHPRTIYKLGSRTLLGCYGLESDANSLVKSIEEKFQDHIDEEVEPESIARVISDILYQSNLYVSPIIVGLTKECKPFICSMDGLGAQTRSDTYAAIGTSSSGLLALCESVYQPNLPVEELSALTEKCLKQAFQRDILSGGDIRIVSLKKHNQIEDKIVKFIDV